MKVTDPPAHLSQAKVGGGGGGGSTKTGLICISAWKHKSEGITDYHSSTSHSTSDCMSSDAMKMQNFSEGYAPRLP